MEHQVVSRSDWLDARKALLAREKEFTRLRDEINAERLALPWVKVDKTYVFDTPAGKKTLAELFDGRSQLVVYHFMFGPDWEAGCPGCSFMADHFGGTLAHLNNHDVTLTMVSRAPLAKIEAYKARMGWSMPWVSSFGSSTSTTRPPSARTSSPRARCSTTSRARRRSRPMTNCPASVPSSAATTAKSSIPIRAMPAAARNC